MTMMFDKFIFNNVYF